MSVSLEETIAKLDEAHKRGLLGIYGIKISRILKLLRELQERRKADNEIPFGDSHSFTELDSTINAYEVHGGHHKKVVELLKELRERRERSEIAKPTGESAQIVPNEDLISRKSAIDAIHNLYAIHGSEGSWIDQRDAFNAVNNLPSAQPEPKWIPCSKQLPKQRQEVICQCRANIIKVLKLDAYGDWYQDAEHCYMGGFVIAWMPLPEPYEEGGADGQ